MIPSKFKHKKIIRYRFRCKLNSAVSVEKWILTGDEITQEHLDLQLSGYLYYPAVFAVERNYCAPN